MWAGHWTMRSILYPSRKINDIKWAKILTSYSILHSDIPSLGRTIKDMCGETFRAITNSYKTICPLKLVFKKRTLRLELTVVQSLDQSEACFRYMLVVDNSDWVVTNR